MDAFIWFDTMVVFFVQIEVSEVRSCKLGYITINFAYISANCTNSGTAAFHLSLNTLPKVLLVLPFKVPKASMLTFRYTVKPVLSDLSK